MSIQFPEGFPFTRRQEPVAPAPAATHVPQQTIAPAVAAPLASPAPPAVDPAPIRPPAFERRRAVRQTLVARATVRPDNPIGPGGPSAVGYVSNISLLGVAFHTRKPLSTGERYSIKLEVGPMKWSSRLRVVSCVPHDGGTWDVGAEFVTNELAIRRPRDMAA